MNQYCETEDEKQSNSKRRKEPFQIKTDALLLVEGKDEGGFFDALLKNMKIEGGQIKDVGGEKKFKHEMRNIVKLPGFSKIKKLGYVRDAEQNEAKSAFDSICHDLKKIHMEDLNETKILEQLPCNIGKVEKIGSFKVGFFIMPNNKDKGMLETLCLQSIKDMHCYKEMQAYIECLKKFHENTSSFKLEKAETQVYLASKVPIMNSLGLGACKGHWNFDDSAFYDIKLFLRDLFE